MHMEKLKTGGCWCVMLQKRLLSDSEANNSEKKDARKKDGMVLYLSL